MITALDGKTFKRIFLGGGRWLTLHRRFLNKLNVFPVPDGDTGTNMSFTVRGALKALADTHPSETIGQVTQKAALGALWEAHGNSGVIFSQILHGFACSLNDKIEASVEDLAEALKKGTEFAYCSVQTPTEGTILSFIRILAEQATIFLQHQQNDKAELKLFLDTILEKGRFFFDVSQNDNRPEALRQAQLVDSGALGLYFFLTGMLRVAQQRSLSIREANKQEEALIAQLKLNSAALYSFVQAPDYQYCSEFLLTDYVDGAKEKIKSELANLGGSLAIAQTQELLKIHLHTNNPQIIGDILLKYGRLINTKSDNLTEQCDKRQKETSRDKESNCTKREFSVQRIIIVGKPKHSNEKVQIVTDSTCDLNRATLSELGIISVPLRINANGRSYLDGQNLEPQELAEMLSRHEGHVEVSTSHPSPYDFEKIYQSYPNRTIISLHPSAFLSGSYNAACQAAAKLDPERKRIIVINSGSISVGLGCLVGETASFVVAHPQATLSEIKNYLKALANKINLLFTVPSLQYLIKGGRLRAPKQRLERLLKAYYIFSYRGETSIAPLARSFDLNRALHSIAHRVKSENEQHRIHKVLVAYSRNLKPASEMPEFDIHQAVSSLCSELQSLNLPVPILKTETGCAVNVHCGSGAVGVAYLTE